MFHNQKANATLGEDTDFKVDIEEFKDAMQEVADVVDELGPFRGEAAPRPLVASEYAQVPSPALSSFPHSCWHRSESKAQRTGSFK